jgi:hypothetical protein
MTTVIAVGLVLFPPDLAVTRHRRFGHSNDIIIRHKPLRSLMGLRPDHLTAHLKLQYNKCAIATSIANNSTIC